MPSEPEKLVLQERRGAVSVLTLSRPAARNALCDLLMRQLACLLDQLEADPEVKVIVITGQAGVFAAGEKSLLKGGHACYVCYVGCMLCTDIENGQ